VTAADDSGVVIDYDASVVLYGGFEFVATERVFRAYGGSFTENDIVYMSLVEISS